MKPSSSASETTPKSSLSRSMKKSSKSRSKISKSSSLSATPTSASQEISTLANNTDSLKDKVTYRNYAGFGAKSVKVIWEQHDTSETEILSDVYPRLAEDVTYKVWELVNNIKTYARHSGGKVTCELVNEVLKDADVPPILGAGDTEWDKIEYDATFFYNSDKVVLLREEYLNTIQDENVICPDIQSSWVIDRRFSKNLLEFISYLCNALFLGDEESYKFALDTGAFSPQIGCSLKFLFKKLIDMIAFEQKFETIDRSLAFLKAISFNPHSRDVECREQLFHLSEILICLLLGTLNSIIPRKKDIIESVNNFLDNTEQEIKKEVTTLDHMDVEDIRSEYEALYQIMERDGFQERENSVVEAISDANISNIDETSQINNIKQENIVLTELKEESNDGQKFEEMKFSPYKAEIYDFKDIEKVCSTIGCLGSQFGYLQNECTFLIQKRLEKFFESRCYLEDEDYEFICRCILGLISLGEYAFREIIPFLCKINPIDAPEWTLNYFSTGAIFLRGRDDIFLYEWLEELCGHKLQPFMTYFHGYHQRFITKTYRKCSTQTYTINSRILLKILKKQLSKPSQWEDAFPDAYPIITSPKSIAFKFERFCPTANKQKVIKNDDKAIVQQNTFNFNDHVVLGKRKLLKPLSNKKKIVELTANE